MGHLTYARQRTEHDENLTWTLSVVMALNYDTELKWISSGDTVTSRKGRDSGSRHTPVWLMSTHGLCDVRHVCSSQPRAEHLRCHTEFTGAPEGVLNCQGKHRDIWHLMNPALTTSSNYVSFYDILFLWSWVLVVAVIKRTVWNKKEGGAVQPDCKGLEVVQSSSK